MPGHPAPLALAAAALVAAAAAATTAGAPADDTVEEVVAVVGSTPILASDLSLADLVQLVERRPEETVPAHQSRLLDARIRLELQFRHLELTGVLYRLTVDRDASRRELARRAGPDLERRLADLGLTAANLDQLALRLAAVSAHVEQRLRPRLAVSPADVERESLRLAEQVREQGGRAPPLAELADGVEHLLLERALNAELEQWLEQARERLGVNRFRP